MTVMPTLSIQFEVLIEFIFSLRFLSPVARGPVVHCNINSRLYFAVANGAAPFLLIINTGSSKSDQVKLSINDIKLLQCIKDA